MTTEKEQRTANSTFAIGGVSYSADSLVVAESFVLRINICAKKPSSRPRLADMGCVLGRNEDAFL